MSFVSTNPATGQKLKTYRKHTPAQVSAALEKAHSGFLGWRELVLPERARHVLAISATLRAQKETLAELITAEMGKPLAEARGEIEKCANCCDFYAKHAARLLRSERPLGAPKRAKIVFDPLGVILAIMPWNFPFWQTFRAAAPALMAGNTVILKHASNVSGCALAIEQVFVDAGVPTGLLQSLLMDPEPVADVIADPRIKAVSLTGSAAAGKKVAALAGAALKPCVLELGGSDPYLIFADADLAHAAEIGTTARLINAGQTCIGAKRFIVVESVREEFEKLLVARMAARSLGDPTVAGTDVGPLAREDLRTELHSQVTRTLRKGARLLLGGVLPEGPGYYYPPTVISGVTKGMPAYSEELFGPVASIISVPDEQAAVEVANDTVYGLGAAVFTKRVRLATQIAIERIEAGMVFVNDRVRSDITLPFGGTKQSGYGRELGSYGIHEFVNIKTVWVS